MKFINISIFHWLLQCIMIKVFIKQKLKSMGKRIKMLLKKIQNLWRFEEINRRWQWNTNHREQQSKKN